MCRVSVSMSSAQWMNIVQILCHGPVPQGGNAELLITCIVAGSCLQNNTSIMDTLVPAHLRSTPAFTRAHEHKHYLRYLLICMDTTLTKNTGHPFFHEWTSNQRSGRATNTTRLQIAVRVFLVPIKIPNMPRNG